MVMALMLAAKIGGLMVDTTRRGKWAPAPSGSGLASGGENQPKALVLLIPRYHRHDFERRGAAKAGPRERGRVCRWPR